MGRLGGIAPTGATIPETARSHQTRTPPFSLDLSLPCSTLSPVYRPTSPPAAPPSAARRSTATHSSGSSQVEATGPRISSHPHFATPMPSLCPTAIPNSHKTDSLETQFRVSSTFQRGWKLPGEGGTHVSNSFPFSCFQSCSVHTIVPHASISPLVTRHSPLPARSLLSCSPDKL